MKLNVKKLQQGNLLERNNSNPVQFTEDYLRKKITCL